MVSWKESCVLVLNSCELTSAPVMIGPFIDDDEEEEHDIDMSERPSQSQENGAIDVGGY